MCKTTKWDFLSIVAISVQKDAELEIVQLSCLLRQPERKWKEEPLQMKTFPDIIPASESRNAKAVSIRLCGGFARALTIVAYLRVDARHPAVGKEGA